MAKQTHESQVDEPDESWSRFWLFAAAATAITFAYPQFIAWLNVIPSPQARSTFGDQYGALSALSSALGFGALIYTISLQRRDLRMQRIELQMQRQSMKESRDELAKQAKAQEQYVKATLLAARINGTGQALMACVHARSQSLVLDLTQQSEGGSKHTSQSLYQDLMHLLESSASIFHDDTEGNVNA